MSTNEASAPVGASQPPAGRKFPCANCGARLDFDPSSRALQCPYCGHKETIEPSSTGVVERSWEEYWQHQAAEEAPIAGRSSQVTCGGCGAVVLLQDQVATDRCPYCATHLENKPEAAQAMIQPGGLLPFAVSERDGIKAFDAWIAGRWFAPTGLRQFANLGKLNGAYVPYWTYDSMTYTHYRGERGDNYTVTETYTENETYTETDSSGNNVTRSRPVTKTRQVTHIRWSSASGEVQHFFDDVLIYGSKSLPDNLVGGLATWDLDQLQDFKAEYLSGFQTERYTVNLKDGFDQARQVMDGEIRTLCCRDIGGDHQRLHAVNTQHVGVTFKHLLLPMWVAAYRYHDQPYQILINGRTGDVVGNRPYSFWKIALLVVAIILAVILFAVVAAGAKGARASNDPVGLYPEGVASQSPGLPAERATLGQAATRPVFYPERVASGTHPRRSNPFRVERLWGDRRTQGAPLRGDPGLWDATPSGYRTDRAALVGVPSSPMTGSHS